jgi:FG-GAP-like repeat
LVATTATCTDTRRLSGRRATATARLCAVATGGLLAAATYAQGPLYRDATATHLPQGLAGPCMDAAAGDADGDGDLDLALAMEFQPNVLLLNDGHGVFSEGVGRLPRTMHDSEDVAFADFDRDGDLDLVFVSEDDKKDELYLNDGTGHYSDASARLGTDEVSNALAVLDLDGDGAPDLLIGNVGIKRVLMNDGHGRFRDETKSRWPQTGESRTQDLELADVDGDGDEDVVVANEGQNQLYLNDHGRLVDVTASSLPARNDESREIRAADVDRDGDLDLLVANVRFGMQESPQDYLLLNDGRGRFTTAEHERYPEDARSNFTVQAVDLDHDGDLDVIAPSTTFPRREARIAVLYTDAAGHAAVAAVQNLDLRDVDGDGDQDIVATDGEHEIVFRAERGRFLLADASAATTSAFEDVDVDDDGKIDIATARLALGELPGAQQGSLGDLEVADVDRDGDIDVIVSGTTALEPAGDYLVLLNDGAGRFTVARPGTILPAESAGNGFDVEVADFDGDGDGVADLFLCNRAGIPAPAAAAARAGGLQRLLLGSPAASGSAAQR